MERITWAQLDPFGQVTGTPYTGDVRGLRDFIGKDVADIAKFERDDTARYYDTPSGRTIHCTMITMTTPWGRWRFVPVDATTMPRRRRRLASRPRPR